MFAVIVQIKLEICKEKVCYVLKRKKINLAPKQILFCRAIVSVFTETVLLFTSDKVSGMFHTYFHFLVILYKILQNYNYKMLHINTIYREQALLLNFIN